MHQNIGENEPNGEFSITYYQNDPRDIGAVMTIKLIQFLSTGEEVQFAPLRFSVVMGPLEETMRPFLENPPGTDTYILSNEDSLSDKEEIWLGKTMSGLSYDEIDLILKWN